MTITHAPTRRCTEHGAHRAGCPACRAWNRWYNQHRRAKVKDGQWAAMVPVEPVRAHIAHLRDAGMRLVDIAGDSGIPVDTIGRIAFSSRQVKVTPLTASLLCDVQPRPVEGALVPAIGTIRRLRALARLGWSSGLLAGHVGISREAVQKLSDSSSVTRVSRDRVSAAYERLSGTRGSSRLTALRGERCGWPPPIAWEGVDIDDPDAVPDLGGDGDDVVDDEAIRRVIAGDALFRDLRMAEKLALFRDHLDTWGFNEVMRLLGMSGKTVQKWRARVAEAERVAA